MTLKPTASKVLDGLLLAQMTEFVDSLSFCVIGNSDLGGTCHVSMLDLVMEIRQDILQGRIVVVASEDCSVVLNCLYVSAMISSLIGVG